MTYAPGEVAIERVFMHRNPDSALKLGQARGAALCGACHGGAEVFEYAARAIKQSVTGTGAAEKGQVQHMIKALLALQGKLSRGCGRRSRNRDLPRASPGSAAAVIGHLRGRLVRKAPRP